MDAQHARLASIFAEVVHSMLPFGLSTSDELHATISLAHLAARRVREELCERGARSGAEKIHWILVWLRAWRGSDGHAVQRAVRAVPEILGGDGASAVANALTLLASLVEQLLSGDGSEDGASGVEESVEVLD